MTQTLASGLGLGTRGVVSLVGGGGKTTLMFRLARELADGGSRVLTTTTTKVARPHPAQSAHVLIRADSAALIQAADRLLQRGIRHMTAAHGCGAAPDKLAGLPLAALTAVIAAGRFDWILVEADGAKRRPLKAPAAHEPVVPRESTDIVAVVGLEAIGQPLAAPWVFRCDQYARISGLAPGTAVTPESAVAVLTHPRGIMKGAPAGARRCVFLNKADDTRRLALGRELAAALTSDDNGPQRVVVGALRSANPVRWVHVRGGAPRDRQEGKR
jgi:probable selenium-dependent hydroxylase accessory protein YqeC